MITALIFLLMLSILVLIHEAGHFFVAKKLGIKVEEFGFGLPPRAIGKKIGETIYSINWLPIGGFVKLYGEDEAGGGRLSLSTTNTEQLTTNKNIHRAFYARSVGQRAAVVVAGVVMNAMLAVIIFYLYLVMSGFKAELPLFGDHTFLFVNQYTTSELVVSSISKNSPAKKAGLAAFSKIVSVNRQKPKDTNNFIDLINQNRGKEVTVVWIDTKTNKTFTSKMIPRLSPPKNEGALGIGFFLTNTVTLSYETVPQKIFSGIIHPVNLMAYNFDVMGRLLRASIVQKSAAPLGNSVSGPVGIYSLIGNIVEIPNAKEKIVQILNLAGILSISLAFFNILPIPALDGGRFFFIVVEAITGKKVNQRFENMAHSIGMALLLTLIALITLKDITRILQ